MKIIPTHRAVTLLFATAIALAACDSGSSRATVHDEHDGHDHSSHDHGDHSGHDHDDHAGHDHGPAGEFVPSTPKDGVVDVFASNYPLKYFAERIGGDSVKVHFLPPADVDPAYWQPAADDVKQMQSADILLFNGATYEKWAPTVTLSESRIVDTSASFSDQFVVMKSATTHSHGPGGEHSHSGTSFTTWLDPALAVKQAEAIAAAFSAQQPDRKAEHDAGLAELKAALMALDTRIAAIVEGKTDRPLVASHPVYDYLAQRYSLDLHSMLWEPDEVPPAEEWVKLAETLSEHPAKFMIWEAEPADETKRKLADEEVVPIIFEPLMNVPESGDYFSRMDENITRLEAAFK